MKRTNLKSLIIKDFILLLGFIVTAPPSLGFNPSWAKESEYIRAFGKAKVTMDEKVSIHTRQAGKAPPAAQIKAWNKEIYAPANKAYIRETKAANVSVSNRFKKFFADNFSMKALMGLDSANSKDVPSSKSTEPIANTTKDSGVSRVDTSAITDARGPAGTREASTRENNNTSGGSAGAGEISFGIAPESKKESE